MFPVQLSKPAKIRREVSFRKLMGISAPEFGRSIAECQELQNTNKPLEALVNAYDNTLRTLVDQYAPVCKKTITLRPNTAWYSEELRTAKRLKRKLERNWRESKLHVDKGIYQTHAKLVNRLLHSTKAAYYSDKISECSSDQKQLFKVTKSLIGSNETDLLPEHSNSSELAEEFNTFFNSKISKIRATIRENRTSNDVIQAEHDVPFEGLKLSTFEPATEEEVQKIISSAPSASCALDPAPTWLIKRCSDQLVPVITAIVNKSLADGEVPEDFKKALVRPLLKKPGLDKDVLKNYRPVCNLPFLSKILERVVAKRMDTHLDTNRLHDRNQSAYRRHHSTESALLKVQTDIVEALDQGSMVVLIMLDLSAAFDTLDHDILLNRLKVSVGVESSALKWFRSYISNRTQAVAIGSETSESTILECGVPQGSVLGPKQYCMYTRPVGRIAEKANLSHQIYADDTQGYMVVRSRQEWKQAANTIEACVNNIRHWMGSNMLKLNDEKFEFIVFSPKHRTIPRDELTLSIQGTTFHPAGQVRNLGVIQDSSLTMEKHVNAVTRSGYHGIHRIGRIRRFITPEACRALIQAWVTSRLDYSNVLYFGLPKTLLGRLQRLQNTAARLITRTQRREHITPILYKLHWLPVEYRPIYKVILYTYKALHDLAPVYIRELIDVYEPSRTLRSTSRSLLKVPRTKTATYGKRSFRLAAPQLWNTLPDDVKNAPSLASFKKLLKTHLFKQAYNV